MIPEFLDQHNLLLAIIRPTSVIKDRNSIATVKNSIHYYQHIRLNMCVCV